MSSPGLPPPSQLQPKAVTVANTHQTAQPIALTTAPTALVLIPQTTNQSSSKTSMQPTTTVKTTNITTSINATSNTQSPVVATTTPIALSTAPIHMHAAPITTSIPTPVPAAAHIQPTTTTTTLSASIQMQAPVTTPAHTPGMAQMPTAAHIVPITAHQQTSTMSTPIMNNRHPPQTLPIVPITSMYTTTKPEPNKYVCCLLDNGNRCDRVAGNASFSARIQKIVGTKKMNFALDPAARHAYICEHHKAIITLAKKSTVPTNQAHAMDATNNSSGTLNHTGGDDNNGGIEVDLQQLQVNTLRRYKRHFRVQTRPGLNKLQLAESLKNHFRTLPIIEKEAITYFVYIVKCYRNKLDHNPVERGPK